MDVNYYSGVTLFCKRFCTLLSCFCVYLVPDWLFTLPHQICYAFRSPSLSPLCFTVCFPLYILNLFYLFLSLALWTILLWRRQTKTWPPCLKLVDVGSWVYLFALVPLNLPLSSTFPCFSWHSFYVFFTPSFTSHQSSHLRHLWALLELKKKRSMYQFMCSPLTIPCSLSPDSINNFMFISFFMFPSSYSAFFLPYSILYLAIKTLYCLFFPLHFTITSPQCFLCYIAVSHVLPQYWLCPNMPINIKVNIVS